MRKRIIIPKKGPHVGEIIVEGMEQNVNCEAELTLTASAFGPVSGVTKKDHFGDDNPVHDRVTIN